MLQRKIPLKEKYFNIQAWGNVNFQEICEKFPTVKPHFLRRPNFSNRKKIQLK